MGGKTGFVTIFHGEDCLIAYVVQAVLLFLEEVVVAALQVVCGTVTQVAITEAVRKGWMRSECCGLDRIVKQNYCNVVRLRLR